MKFVLVILSLLIVIGGVFVFWKPASIPSEQVQVIPAAEMEKQDTMSSFISGDYQVRVEESEIKWAGKKPLIEGYVNSGAIGIKEGVISTDGVTANGSLTIDMNTLSVSNTPTKPGKESMLEGHLKSANWFDVGQFPTATFNLIEMTPQAESATTFKYDVRGELTMKGQTHEILFPATIYQSSDGLVHASASLEFDRTKWGITSGSNSFFDNLADNAIDNMVALSFNLVAE